MGRKSQGSNIENDRPDKRPLARVRARARARRRAGRTPPPPSPQQPPTSQAQTQQNQNQNQNQTHATPSPASSSSSNVTNVSSSAPTPLPTAVNVGPPPPNNPATTTTSTARTPAPVVQTPSTSSAPPAVLTSGAPPSVPTSGGTLSVPTSGAPPTAEAPERQEPVMSDYQLLLTPLFAAMTKITDHLFLTGVGGMTRENFRRNHIDFVVNITTEAPFWDDIESMRVPLDDDVNANILPYLDVAVDRINEAISKRNSHVLVHCVAGVSRSATIVIAYLMKIKRMDLRTAFNFCYNLRPVIRPNNGFMHQLINYEYQLFNRHSVHMVDVEVDGTLINVPSFFVDQHPKLVLLEVMRVKELQRRLSRETKSKSSIKDNKSSHSTDD